MPQGTSNAPAVRRIGKLVRLATWPLILAGTISCGKTLSRPAAGKLIAAQQRLPRTQTIDIAPRYLKRSWSKPVKGFGNVTVCVNQGQQYSDVEPRLLYYRSQGLIDIGFERVEDECPGIWATITLTDAGKKHLVATPGGVYQVRVFTLAFGDVTGIQAQEQTKTATADYTLKVGDVTPFGGDLSSAPLQQTAAFALFDDGWRIQPADLAIAPIQYQPPNSTASIEEARRLVAAAEAAEEKAHQSEAAVAEVNKELKAILTVGWYPEQNDKVKRLLTLGANINSISGVSLFTRSAQHDPDAVEFLKNNGFRFDSKALDTGNMCPLSLMSANELRSDLGKRAFELLLKYGATTNCTIPIGHAFVNDALLDSNSSIPDAIAGLAWLKDRGINLKAKYTIDDSWMPDIARRRTGKTLRDVLVQDASKLDTRQQTRLRPLIDYLDK